MNEALLFDITLHDLAPVGAVMLLGLLGGKLAKKAHLPKVSGYLITGIIIGPSVLGLVSSDVVAGLSMVNDIALGLIMFAIGGVFELNHIRTVGRRIFWLTFGQALTVVLFTAGGLLLVGLDFYTSLLLGMIAIATAPAATLLVIREFEAEGDFTDTLITVTATTNIVCILAFEFTLSFGSIANGSRLSEGLVRPFYELGGSLLIGLVLGYLISRWEEHVEDQAELLMIIVAGIMLTVGLALTLGLQPLFATLILGAMTTNLSMMHRLVYVELRQVEQPLYIAFFVLAGASLHLELLPGLGIAGLTYFAMRIVGKVVGTFAVGRWKRLSPKISNYLGIGMIVQAGVAIGLVDYLNRTEPELGKVISPIILATILIYETIGPPVIEWVLYKAGDVRAHSIK